MICCTYSDAPRLVLTDDGTRHEEDLRSQFIFSFLKIFENLAGFGLDEACTVDLIIFGAKERGFRHSERRRGNLTFDLVTKGCEKLRR